MPPRIHAGGYQSVYVVALAAVDDGTERDLLGRRIAYGQRGRSFGQALDELVGDAFVDQVASGCHADLALVQKRAPSGS